MQLIEKARCNHALEAFQDEGQVRVRLLDASGDGGFVDPAGIIKQDGSWFVPLEGGGTTVSSVDDVLFILRHISMPVQRYEGWSGTEYVIEPGILPTQESDRRELLTCGSKEVLWAAEAAPAPLWFQVREQARGATSLSLF